MCQLASCFFLNSYRRVINLHHFVTVAASLSAKVFVQNVSAENDVTDYLIELHRKQKKKPGKKVKH